MVLIGNHFAQPQHVPAWIMPAEQPTEMFCVSNRKSKHFIMILLGGGCFFMFSAIAMQLERRAVPMYGEYARARAAWYETCQQQN
eukprot:5745411-Amphidinium_carterae.1